MKTAVKALAATAALAFAGSAALAQTVPPQPAPGPMPDAGTGNGGLIVTIWDAVRGVSLIQYLGLQLDSILPSTNMTQPGFVLNFGTIGAFNSVFGTSQAGNIQYHVTAADSTGSGVSAGRRIAATAGLGSVPTPTTGQVRDSTVRSRDFTQLFILGTGGCNGANPCIAENSSQGQYGGGDGWGATIGGFLPNAAATVGTALGFYLATTASTLQAPPTISVYQAATGFGQWLLTAGGQLTYSVPAIPLPAAVWLLLSGLVGLTAVSRRRRAAA